MVLIAQLYYPSILATNTESSYLCPYIGYMTLAKAAFIQAFPLQKKISSNIYIKKKDQVYFDCSNLLFSLFLTKQK